MVQKDESSQRTTAYMSVPFMDHQGATLHSKQKTNFSGKEHQTHLMDPSTSDSSHAFSQPEMHHEEQVQRVVSPANHPSMAHFQAQYSGYDAYHRTDLDGNPQNDPRQQV